MSSDAVIERFGILCEKERAAVNDRLGLLVGELASAHDGMRDAISYSLMDGGKRLRPMLCLLSHDLAGGTARDVALDAACAVECLHTYSLIHDDLPCMDDDDYRRGKPSSHKKFGESTAVLAGDALLTLAFEVISTIRERRADAGVEQLLEMVKILSAAAGTRGLITGQMLDMEGSSLAGDLNGVRRIHQNKTASLIAATMEMGAVSAGADGDTRSRIRAAGEAAGEAFQIVDDILDCEKDRETLGKTPGKDSMNDKLTYPAVAGIEAAKARAQELIAEAKDVLPVVGKREQDKGDVTGAKKEAGVMIRATFDFLVSRSA